MNNGIFASEHVLLTSLANVYTPSPIVPRTRHAVPVSVLDAWLMARASCCRTSLKIRHAATALGEGVPKLHAQID